MGSYQLKLGEECPRANRRQHQLLLICPRIQSLRRIIMCAPFVSNASPSSSERWRPHLPVSGGTNRISSRGSGICSWFCSRRAGGGGPASRNKREGGGAG